MASNAPSRKTARKELAAIIDAAFDATWDVFAYKTLATFNKAKNIAVGSAGSGRTIAGADTETSDAAYRFSVYIFVLYQDTENAWTAENSEDALDDAEKALTDVLTDNQEHGTYWQNLIIEGFSEATSIIDELGRTYRRETVTIRIDKWQ